MDNTCHQPGSNVFSPYQVIAINLNAMTRSCYLGLCVDCTPAFSSKRSGAHLDHLLAVHLDPECVAVLVVHGIRDLRRTWG